VNELLNTQQLLSEKLLLFTERNKKNNGFMRGKDEDFKKKYELCVLLLGQKEDEIRQLSQDMIDMKKVYKEQISSLVDRIEDFKKGKK
jgi:hypothetical protein